MKLIAFRIRGVDMPIRTAPVERDWMDATDQRFAYRCLPLAIANQYGWEILCPVSFIAVWNGEKDVAAVTFKTEPGTESPAISHFGSGVLTFHLPYLFRTEPGYDLMVQGPINRPKDAIAPLQGIIETDWSPFTFTMNWIFTQPEIEVEFEKGEPICHLFPIRRGELETIEPEIRALESEPELHAKYQVWAESRRSFNVNLKEAGSKAQSEKWQKEYFRGQGPGGGVSAPPDHRTKVRLREFKR
jgi:hypothetical protein